jgi:hypothetical protein
MVLSLEDWGPITAQQIVVQQESTHVSHIEVIEKQTCLPLRFLTPRLRSKCIPLCRGFETIANCLTSCLHLSLITGSDFFKLSNEVITTIFEICR